MDELLATLVFWGVWLLIPLLIDGVKALVGLLAAASMRARASRPRPMPGHLPLITLMLPIYNSAETLPACLAGVAAQDYPLDRIEVLLVDNGSRDNSFEVFCRLQGELPLVMRWVRLPVNGKAWAVNAGIHLGRGEFFVNVDSDAVLDPGAVRAVVRAFASDPTLVAVTGSIAVLPAAEDATPTQLVLAACEWFEYLQSFQIGRVADSALNNMFTLSGAFSAFRRASLLQTGLYTQRTITEDCDLTFELHALKLGRVGSVPEAIASVHPIEGLAQLYAQRVRWQRGQVEVSAQHPDLLRRPIWHLQGFAPARTMLIDHTLAFPRVAWTLLLLLLPSFGYEAAMLVQASAVMYLLYLLIDLASIAAAMLIAPASLRAHLPKIAWAIPLLPLYRMLIFWFRLSGYLHAVAEPGAWRVQDPLTQIRAAARDTRGKIATRLSRGSDQGEQRSP